MSDDLKTMVYVIVLSCVVLTMFAMQTAMIGYKRSESKRIQKLQALEDTKRQLDENKHNVL